MQKSLVFEPSTAKFRPFDACRNQARIGSTSRTRRARQSGFGELLFLQKEIRYSENVFHLWFRSQPPGLCHAPPLSYQAGGLDQEMPLPAASSPLPHPTCTHLQDKDLTPSHLPQNGCLETAGPESKAALHHLFDCKCLNSPTEVISALRQRGVDSAMVENVINVALSWTARWLWSCCCLVLGLLLTPPSFLNSEVHYWETLFGFPCLRALWCSCHHRSCCWDSTSSLTIWKDFTERGSIFLASRWSKSAYFSFSPLNRRIQLRQRYRVFHICCCWVDEHTYLLENNVRALLIPTKELLFLLHRLLGELRTFRGGENKFSSWVLLQTPKPLHVCLLENDEGRSVWERPSSPKRNV